MNTEAAVIDPRVMKALNGRRAAARATEAPIDWAIESLHAASIVALAKRCAATPATPIIIQGERGCGVQALARLIHDEDPRSRHERFRVIPAHFVSAGEMRGWPNQGTVAIEDVENLKSAGQSWVADMVAGRAGRDSVRIIATSRYSVGELLLRRHLSQEVIHALDVFRLVIPPLRERREEIGPIARSFLKHYGEASGYPFLRFTPGALEKLTGHAYPANVCELRNVVERAVALRAAEDGDISADAIVFYDGSPEPVSRKRLGLGSGPRRTERTSVLPSLAEVEMEYLTGLIRELHGRRTEIARTMGVSYPTVLKKIARYGLDVRAILSEDRVDTAVE